MNMTKWQKLHWWLYVLFGVTILFFLVPALVSAKDTLAVLIGVALLIAFGYWSWELWVRRVFNWVEIKVEEEVKK